MFTKKIIITFVIVFTLITVVVLRVLNRPVIVDQIVKEHFPEGIFTDVDLHSKRIDRYHYKGKNVYYVPPRCCDVPGVLIDSNGKYICSPSGGYNGMGDGKCPDFYEQAVQKEKVWP